MLNLRTARLVTWLNIIDLLAVSFALFLAFLFQFVLKELPCPLCLLQRLGLLAMGFGFLLNVRYSIRPCHYAFIILAAFFTAAAALRQTLLHVVPGSGSYGAPFLGFHLYTWMFIIASLAILYIAIVLCIPGQYTFEQPTPVYPVLKKLSHLAFICLLALSIANIVNTWLECGVYHCPDSPTQYQLFNE